MREIKFRAWDKEEKKYLLPEKQGFIIVPTLPSFGVTLPYHRGRNFSGDEDCFDWADADLLMGRYELEQYTGLKDKNGKEIYEGDIVEYVTYYYGNEKRHRKVIEWEEWDSDDFGEPHNLGYFNLDEGVEVIGNIHENQELLGGDE